MPRKKVPFITRREAQHYTVVHRSQTDGGYGQEELPSDFVLVPSGSNPNHEKHDRGDNSTVNTRSVKFNDNEYYEYDDDDDNFNYHANRNRKNTKYTKYQDDDEDNSNDDNLIKKWRMRNGNKDHITPQGYKNDGYDYDQHFSVGGGGKLVTKDGKILDNPFQEVIDLPTEALPSSVDLERANDTMTIDPGLMDPDLRAALFDNADDDGEFEVLDDDFISQVMSAPEKPDFDWDAHMAMLLAKSEERCVGKPARPWVDDSKLLGYEKYLNENEEYDSEGEIESYDEDDNEQDYANLSSDQRAKLDADFERRLAEYDDDNLGYIDDIEEEEIQGTIDLDGDNALLQSALDEFIEEQKDYHLPQHGFVKNVYEYRKIVPKAVEEVSAEPVDIKKEFQEQKLMQQVCEIEKGEIEQREKSGTYNELATCQEYLREERVQEQWDCETILSTYSTLDNHPSLIKEPTKFKPYKSNHAKNIEADESTIVGSIKIGEGKATRIVLKGKYDLPEGYNPYKIVQRREDKPVQKDRIIAFNTKSIMKANGNITENDNKNQEDDDSEDDDEDDDDDDDDTNMVSHMSTLSISRKGETAEEKKARKAAIKEQRRLKRATKKEVKNLYLNESLRQIKLVSKEQKIDNVSVFKYSM